MTTCNQSIKKTYLAALITALACGTSLVFWLIGLLHMPADSKQIAKENTYTNEVLMAHSPDYVREKKLAESYWFRYPSLQTNTNWGKDGPKGIWGPRDHYRTHGRFDGWIWGPIIRPKDLVREKKLAEAYWNRYPEIANSKVWGRKSNMGLLAPRDHYHYVGRILGNKWGLEDDMEQMKK